MKNKETVITFKFDYNRKIERKIESNSKEELSSNIEKISNEILDEIIKELNAVGLDFITNNYDK